MRDYKELLDLVSGIEGPSSKRSVSYVKMDVGAGEPLSPGSPKSYSQLLGEVMETMPMIQLPRQRRPMPTPAPIQQQETPPAPQPQPAALPQKVAVSEQLQKPKARWSMPAIRIPRLERRPARPEAAKPEVEQAIIQPAPTPPQQTKPLEESAAIELNEVVKEAEITTPPPPQQVTIQPSKLVLPTLSLPDQVEELNKIVDNLKRSSFSSEQLEVVREEVEGLAEALSSRSEQAVEEGMERDMLYLRRARLSEALSLIGGS